MPRHFAHFLLPSLLLAGCGSEVGVDTIPNHLPTATITHPDGPVPEGVVALRGTVSDNDALNALTVTWSIAGTPIEGCENIAIDREVSNDTNCEATLFENVTVTLEVSDGIASAQDSRDVEVIPTDAPIATLLDLDSDSVKDLFICGQANPEISVMLSMTLPTPGALPIADRQLMHLLNQYNDACSWRANSMAIDLPDAGGPGQNHIVIATKWHAAYRSDPALIMAQGDPAYFTGNARIEGSGWGSYNSLTPTGDFDNNGKNNVLMGGWEFDGYWAALYPPL